MRLLAPLLAAVLLAGCGLKDDLYLPPPKPAATPVDGPAATQSPAPGQPADDQDDGEDDAAAAGARSPAPR